MTQAQLLIVEDDEALARTLGRAVARARPGYGVTTAVNGVEALAVLERADVDVVLTDLNMDGMDGYQLIAWLMTARPSVLVFAMTGDASDEATGRLRALGGIECFEKPLDVSQLVARFSESLEQRVQGQVQNLSLASLLQVIEMERKTCALEVRGDEVSGRLYVRRGVLVDARAGALVGEEAALRILDVEGGRITIEPRCASGERTIVRSLSQLLMEAMRLRDERSRDGGGVASEPSASGEADEGEGAPSPSPGWAKRLRPSVPPLPSLPTGATAALLLEIATGAVLTYAARDAAGIAELAECASAIVRRTEATLVSGRPDEAIEEIVLSSSARCELIRPLPDRPGDAVLLVFDPAETNLAVAQLELTRVLREYTATWPDAVQPASAVQPA